MRSKGSLSVHRPALALAPAIVGLLWLGGCTDQTADERAEVRADIAAARVELTAAAAGMIRPGADGYEAARQKLEAVVTKLEGITGGSNGQQGARALLTSTALQELAAMDIDAIDVVMEDINRLRESAAANTRAALTLSGLAEVRSNPDLTDERSHLDDAGAGTQRQLTDVNQKLAELSDPIAQRTQQNEQDLARVAELRDQAEELYRRADAAGAADGLNDYLEAQQLMRDADKLERAISDRMIDLDYNYAAEHARMTMQTEALRAQLEAVGTARADLDKLVQALNADASASRAKAQELAAAARDALNEIETRQTNDLLPLYESATKNLTDAATQAQSAAGKLGRDSAGTARIARARALATLGQLSFLHANALKRQLDVVTQLGSVPDMQNIASKAAALKTRHDEALAAATQAYTDARDAVASAGGTADAAKLQQQLDAIVAKLTGAPPPAPPTTTTTTPAGDGRPSAGNVTPPNAAASSGGSGLASPEEFVSIMMSNDMGDIDSSRRLMGACTASTPAGRSMLQTIQADTAFEEAMVNQFGGDATRAAFAAATGSSENAVQDGRVDSQDDTSAVMSFVMTGVPGRISVNLVNRNGAWFMDMDSFADSISTMAGGDMLMQVLQVQTAAMQAVTPHINAGEFADAPAAAQAFITEIQSRMGG